MPIATYTHTRHFVDGDVVRLVKTVSITTSSDNKRSDVISFDVPEGYEAWLETIQIKPVTDLDKVEIGVWADANMINPNQEWWNADAIANLTEAVDFMLYAGKPKQVIVAYRASQSVTLTMLVSVLLVREGATLD